LLLRIGGTSGGALRTSPVLAAKLTAAEAELAQLEAGPKPTEEAADVARLLVELPIRAQRAVDALERTLASGDLVRAREEIKNQVGEIRVEVDEREIRLLGERGIAATLLKAVGCDASSVGSGGVICISNTPDFIDIPLR
jgi:hypothetical protein